MKDFFCEYLDLDIRIPEEVFEKDAFYEDVKDVLDENSQGVHMWYYGSIEMPNEQHAHIVVDFRKVGRVRLKITYHASPHDHKDIRAPYMEDCAQWLGRFVKEDEVSAELSAFYEFDKTYSPIIAMPFPLLASNKELAGAQVTGVKIQLPRRMNIKNVVLELGKKKTGIYADLTIKVNLKQFDLNAQLMKLSKPIMTLVTRNEPMEEVQ
jgi:hypothetical protein